MNRLSRPSRRYRAAWVQAATLAATVAAQGHGRAAETGPIVPDSTLVGLPPAHPQYVSALGKRLQDIGIFLRGNYTGDFIDYAAGGRQTGAIGDNQVAFGADLDLETIMGVAGGEVHALIVSRFGASDNKKYIGSVYETLSDAGPIVTTRLAEFSYDQSLFGDRVRLLFGRIPVGQEFATSTLYCQFVSGVCLNMSPFAWPRNSSIGYWPLASWGGRITLKPTPLTYIKAGVFQADPNAYEQSGWPWNGGWSSSAASGAFIPAEIGYASTLADKPFPNGVDVGGYLDTTAVNDALYNRAGLPYPLYHGTYRKDRDRASVYVQAQQTVWRPDRVSNRGLTIFGGALFGISGASQTNSYFLAGLVERGILAARPNDAIGLMTYTTLLNQRVIEAYADTLEAKHLQGNLSRSETTFELNYSVSVLRGVLVKPFGQLVMHPDQIGLPRPDPADTHAWTVGVQISLLLNDVFGLPSMIRKN